MSADTVSPETNLVPFPSPLTTRRDYGRSILTRLHTGTKRNDYHEYTESKALPARKVDISTICKPIVYKM
jgi:hypothetical protein